MQAGSYVAELKDEARRRFKDEFGRRLAGVLDALAPGSLLDAGVGEATSLAPVLRHMAAQPAHVLGFDLSLSRLLYARGHLEEQRQDNVVLFTAALDRIPLASASVDVVLTMHAVEPNHGREDVILAELLRVARRYLVMIEPSYELASAEGRARMERLGYVRELPAALERLGHKARRVEPWPLNANPLNPAALIVVDKQADVLRRCADLRVADQRPHADPPRRLLVLSRRRSRVSDHRRNSMSHGGKWYPGEQARPVLNNAE